MYSQFNRKNEVSQIASSGSSIRSRLLSIDKTQISCLLIKLKFLSVYNLANVSFLLLFCHRFVNNIHASHKQQHKRHDMWHILFTLRWYTYLTLQNCYICKTIGALSVVERQLNNLYRNWNVWNWHLRQAKVFTEYIFTEM